MALAPKALRLIELRFVVALAVVVPGVAWPAFGRFAWFCLRPADDSGAVRRQDAVDRRADALLLGAAEAARAGGITKISTVDYKVDNLFNLLVTHTCIVTGE